MPGVICSDTLLLKVSFHAPAQSFSASQKSVSQIPYLNPRHSMSTNQTPSDRICFPHAILQSRVSLGHKPADRTFIFNGLYYYLLNKSKIVTTVLPVVSITVP